MTDPLPPVHRLVGLGPSGPFDRQSRQQWFVDFPSHIRVVPITEYGQLLRAHRAAQAAVRLETLVWRDPDAVWTVEHRCPLESCNVHRLLTRALRAAEVPTEGPGGRAGGCTS